MGSAEPGDSVNVFTYLDYREYLRDFYAWRKRVEYGFSHRSFSRRAGLRSTNYLKLVMDGQRNLTQEMGGQFAKACHLDDRETDYFCELVAYNQARDTREASRCHERLQRFREYRSIHKLDAAQAAYHGTWYMPAIRELAARADFRDDPKWVASVLRPRITSSEAQAALTTLEDLGLLTRDEEGRLTQATALVSTGAGPHHHGIAEFHRAMMTLAGQAIDSVPRDEREISSVTLCVSREALFELKERIREFRREILQLAELEGNPERVVQVSFQLFPLSE